MTKEIKEILRLRTSLPLGKSDQSVIYFSYQVECIKCAYKMKKTFYEKGNYKAIEQYLKDIDWKQMFIGRNVQKCGIY